MKFVILFLAWSFLGTSLFFSINSALAEEDDEPYGLLEQVNQAELDCNTTLQTAIDEWNDGLTTAINLAKTKERNSNAQTAAGNQARTEYITNILKPTRENESKCQEFTQLQNQLKQNQEQCEKLKSEFKQDQEKQRQRVDRAKEKFDNKEKQITEKEKALSKQKVALQEEIAKFKRSTDKEMQSLKDNKDKALEGIDKQIEQLQEAITKYADEADTLTFRIEQAHNQIQSAQNRFYIRCFSKARQITEREREQFQKMRQTNKFAVQNLAQLAKSKTPQINTHFTQRFNQHLSECVQQEELKLQTKDEQDRARLQIRQFQQAKKRLAQKKAQVIAKIQQLSSLKKVEVLQKFTEKMTRLKDNFDEDYGRKLKKFEEEQKMAQHEIQKIKQSQAEEMWRKSQLFSRQVRRYDNQCDNLLNPFSNRNAMDTGFSDMGIGTNESIQ